MSEAIVDIYGGYTALPIPGGATGKWRTGTVPNGHKVLVTPLGNAFYMRAIYKVEHGNAYNDGLPPAGTVALRYVVKYGDNSAKWGPATIRRFKSWGFNSLAEYSTYPVLPMTTNPAWPGDHTNPEKVPYGDFPLFAAWYAKYNMGGHIPGGIGASVKDLYHLMRKPPASPGQFPDVFDPSFATYVAGRVPNAARNPWFLGFVSDDTDYLRGFGAGPDFPSTSAGKTSPQLGYVAFAGAPLHASAPNIGLPGYPFNYTDQKNYTKLAASAFLQAKYKTIGALNTAWKTNGFYTTFGSAGAYGTGTGIIDEDGSHAWYGAYTHTLSNATPALRVDMDDFLREISAKYHGIYRAAIDAEHQGAMFFGPTSLGAWGCPPRREILQGAAGKIDLVRIGMTSSLGDFQQRELVAEHVGDIPFVAKRYLMANDDSRMHEIGAVTSPNKTQEERGAAMTALMQEELSATVTKTGKKPYAGYLWWEWVDNIKEKGNYGLVSSMDNAYDGKEAIKATGTDPFGYKCGGEQNDYGDVLTAVKAANASIYAALSGASQPEKLAKPTLTSAKWEE